MIAVDTNILIYASLAAEPRDRHIAAINLMEKLAAYGAIIPLQVIGEYLAVCRRKKIVSLTDAQARVLAWLSVYDAIPSQQDDYFSAAEISDHHKLQYFDALIIAVAARARAKILLSEDMQDGLVVEGLRVVNPFVAGNERVIDEGNILD